MHSSTHQFHDSWKDQLQDAWVSVCVFLRRNRLRLLAGVTLLVTFALCWVLTEVFSTYHLYASQLDQKLKDQTLHLPSGIYAAPRRVMIGQQMTALELTERLLRAGYQEGTQASEFAVGDFVREENVITIQTRAFARREQMPPSVRITFATSKANRQVYASQQIVNIEDTVAQQARTVIALPVEQMTADLGAKGQARHSVSFAELPPVLTQALLATEDRRFYEHRGIDPRGIARALWHNWRKGGVREGASTLTQQLVKNHFLTPERTWKRKVAEVMMAIALEQRFTKEQILTLYCERVYLGHSGLNEVYGFKQGAQVWFGKKLSDLTASEAALLVGLIKAPNRYTPNEHTAAAILRRNTVLQAMVETGALTPATLQQARSEMPALMPPPAVETTAAPFFIDYLKRELAKHDAGQGEATDQGKMRVETTLDADLQEAATSAVRQHLARIAKLTAKKAKGTTPEAALIALDPKTGEILAMVGGSNYLTSQLNRVTDAKRQPGSVFKPMVYAAALSQGISPAATYLDAPQKFEFGANAVYQPHNFRRSYSNRTVMLREGIVRSLNVVTVDAARETGLGAVADFAHRAGLPRPDDDYPSMALGAAEATPLDVARAYTVFANQGIRVEPRAIRALTSNGLREETAKVTASVLPATLAHVVTDTLADVVNRGTATQIRRAGFKGAVAGKTGTSRDAWFAGYTPNLLVVVWVGFDDNRELGLTGGEAAVPIFTSFLQRALQVRPDLAAAKFGQPLGIEDIKIDPETGMLADAYCPKSITMKMPASVVPATCNKHFENWQQAAETQQMQQALANAEAVQNVPLVPAAYQPVPTKLARAKGYTGTTVTTASYSTTSVADH